MFVTLPCSHRRPSEPFPFTPTPAPHNNNRPQGHTAGRVSAVTSGSGPKGSHTTQPQGEPQAEVGDVPILQARKRPKRRATCTRTRTVRASVDPRGRPSLELWCAARPLRRSWLVFRAGPGIPLPALYRPHWQLAGRWAVRGLAPRLEQVLSHSPRPPRAA